MGSAVEDVRHRERQEVGLRATQVPVQRRLHGIGCGAGRRQRHAEDGVGAETRFVSSAVERDERRVERRLIGDVHADDLVGDLVLDIPDRLLDALAPISGGVAIAQLDCLMLARRRAGGNDRGTAARLSECGDRDGGIAARVKDFQRGKSREANHDPEV